MPCDNLGNTACCAGPCAKMRALCRDPFTDPKPGDVFLVPDVCRPNDRSRDTEVIVKLVQPGGRIYFHYPGWMGDEWVSHMGNHYPAWPILARKHGWTFLRNDPTKTKWVRYNGGMYPEYTLAKAA